MPGIVGSSESDESDVEAHVQVRGADYYKTDGDDGDFIDDSELYEQHELAAFSAKLSTKHGGFFVNRGDLQVHGPNGESFAETEKPKVLQSPGRGLIDGKVKGLPNVDDAEEVRRVCCRSVACMRCYRHGRSSHPPRCIVQGLSKHERRIRVHRRAALEKYIDSLQSHPWQAPDRVSIALTKLKQGIASAEKKASAKALKESMEWESEVLPQVMGLLAAAEKAMSESGPKKRPQGYIFAVLSMMPLAYNTLYRVFRLVASTRAADDLRNETAQRETKLRAAVMEQCKGAPWLKDHSFDWEKDGLGAQLVGLVDSHDKVRTIPSVCYALVSPALRVLTPRSHLSSIRQSKKRLSI